MLDRGKVELSLMYMKIDPGRSANGVEGRLSPSVDDLKFA